MRCGLYSKRKVKEYLLFVGVTHVKLKLKKTLMTYIWGSKISVCFPRWIKKERVYEIYFFYQNTQYQLFQNYTIKLLNIEALDMMCRPESTNIDRDGAEVNIGILRSISNHVQCLNSQQWFYYIISLNKKKATRTKSWLWTMSWTVLIFFFYMMTNWFHSVKRGMNACFICKYNCRQRSSRLNVV